MSLYILSSPSICSLSTKVPQTVIMIWDTYAAVLQALSVNDLSLTLYNESRDSHKIRWNFRHVAVQRNISDCHISGMLPIPQFNSQQQYKYSLYNLPILTASYGSISKRLLLFSRADSSNSKPVAISTKGRFPIQRRVETVYRLVSMFALTSSMLSLRISFPINDTLGRG